MDIHGILGKLREIETLGLAEAAECNMTAEGEACPVHGMEECAGYGTSMQLEDGPDRDGEYFSNADSMAGSTIGQGGTSGTIPHINEAKGDLSDIIERHRAAVDGFIAGDDLDDDLFDDLYGYYFEEMPYGVQKARDGDPHNWIADRFAEDLRSMGLHDQVDEEAALGGVPFTPLGATNTGPDQVGFVVTGGTNNNYFEGDSMDLNESLSINSSINMADGKVSKTLNVSATDEDVEHLSAMLRMAGLSGQPRAVMAIAQPNQDSKECGCQGECGCSDATMENADHDYGSDKKSSTGEPLDVQDYVWDGPHINQRFGKIGDNTLMSERKDTLLKSLTEQYEQYLAEAELAPSDVGSQSPLTATTRDEFDKDPFSGDDAVTDGSHSPLSTIKRQDVMN
jgi:hypothetical protein